MTTAPESRSKRLQPGGFALLAGVALLLTACASAPLPPTVALDAAESAIGNAELANAGRFASAELAEAREKLSRANSAINTELSRGFDALSEEMQRAGDQR